MPFLPLSPAKIVKVSAFSESVPQNYHTEVIFNSLLWDSHSFFDAANPSCITIPVKLAGWYQILCTVRWVIAPGIELSFDPLREAEGLFYTWLNVNDQVLGNEARSTVNRVTGAKGTSQVMALEHIFAGGDVIKLMLWHSFDPSYIQKLDALSYLTLRKVDGIRNHPMIDFSIEPPEEDNRG